MYISNNKASNYVKPKLIELQEEIDKHTIMARDLSTPLSEINRPKGQEYKKDIAELNSTINQHDVNDIYKLFHPTRGEYTFSSHGTCLKTDHILGHKPHLNKS